MSTRITVTSNSDGLLASAKQVQQANREAQLQRDRDKETVSKINDELNVSFSRAPVGGNPDTSVDRRPAAQRSEPLVGGIWWADNNYGKSTAPGYVYLLYNNVGVTGFGSREISNSYGYQVGSGNGQNWESSIITNNLPAPPETDTYSPTGVVTDPQLTCFGECPNVYLGDRLVGSESVWRHRLARLVLPAGGAKAVVAYSIRTAPYSFVVDQVSYDVVSCQTDDPVYAKCDIVPDYKLIGPRNSATLTADYQYQTFCYLVDDKTIRPIALPAAVADYLLILNPETQLQAGVSPIGEVPVFPAPPSFDQTDGVTMPSNVGVTPQIYYEINQLSPYTGTLRTAADYKGKPIVNWLFDGGYKLVLENTDPFVDALIYAYENIADESPYGFIHAEYKGDPSESVKLLEKNLLTRLSRFTNMRSRAPLSASAYDLEFIPVFDWGDPAYCRTQLLALGFSSSDIT
jgi:hypothetical protein